MTKSRAAALARYYDLDLRDDPGDLDLYRALLTRRVGPRSGAGGGERPPRRPLALAGHEVVALDNDAAMLARTAAAWAARRGRRPAERLRTVEADLTTVRLEERFGMVFIGLNSLLLMADEGAQAAAFRTIAAHLAPDGLAVVDVLLPDAGESRALRRPAPGRVGPGRPRRPASRSSSSSPPGMTQPPPRWTWRELLDATPPQGGANQPGGAHGLPAAGGSPGAAAPRRRPRASPSRRSWGTIR